MEDKEERETGSRVSRGDKRVEPVVRSRWSPKPEQILILESIFNSGMVNPPKDETIRIRKLLEKFGAVGDANVFYWFQNRRSRSRRRQRQIQAAAADQPRSSGGGSVMPNFGYLGSTSSVGLSGNDAVSRDFLSFSGQEFEQDSYLGPQESCDLHYQSGVITVFINGVATDVEKGPLDMKAMFGGGGFTLFHSSGVSVEQNDHGFLLHGLQHGESYFLVQRHS